MAVDNDYDDRHHLRRDVRDAHVNSITARTLAYLALIAAAIALLVSIMAWNKANDSIGKSQQALTSVQGR